MTLPQDIPSDLAQECRAWPFEEAKKVLKRLGGKLPEKGYVLFETGYGPSGLPHIGTFGEVARTLMVMNAFHALAPDMPTKLFCFSDDMDGFRKVPTNVPNQEMLAEHLGKPLTKVPDPFEQYESFAHHNNAKLNEFLDSFGFEYEFISSTDMYVNGDFDEALLTMLAKHEQIQNAVIPILGKERASTYSPFLPVSPSTGKVLQVPILETNPEAGTITFEDEDGTRVEQKVTGGLCKAQWRPDWGMRWYALDVDYEMAGEDLISSADVAGKITEILGGKKPAGFHYKLFLDEENQKISKSKGNGITVEEWLTYAPNESLSYYMYQRPTSGKKLYFDVIPKAVDEYISFLQKMPEQEDEKQIENPAWYIHGGEIPAGHQTPVSFALLLNLASASNAHDVETMWGFIKLYAPDATPETMPFLAKLVEHAVKYYEDFVLPTKSYRAPDERELAALQDLAKRLEGLPKDADGETIQTEVFSAGKENGYDKKELRQWFQAIYEVLLGQSQGPRFGSFIELYGIEDTIALIRNALDGKFLKAA
ncbi:MAG: lysine--tRNA ligase [Micavibrio sp.]|nr:lysine--tRNA ligase [Micavibrio sp.]|tara:strand:- start:113 stop:1723 length:1611 start_codon:yes stop_codon:yes gene_type:complete